MTFNITYNPIKSDKFKWIKNKFRISLKASIETESWSIYQLYVRISLLDNQYRSVLIPHVIRSEGVVRSRQRKTEMRM